MEGTSFSYLAHLVTLPVRVGDVEARFALDTGIGPTLLGEALAHQVGCAPNGETFTGRRMSGQEVSVPLADAPPISDRRTSRGKAMSSACSTRAGSRRR